MPLCSTETSAGLTRGKRVKYVGATGPKGTQNAVYEYVSTTDLRNVNLGVKDKDLSNSYLANNIMTGMNFSGYDF